jgi:hypothetical protein
MSSMKTEDNIISDWLEKNSDPKIEIKVLNEVIDKLLLENKLLKEELAYEKRKKQNKL